MSVVPPPGPPARDAIDAALATVSDPEIGRPLPELGMIKDVAVDGGQVRVDVWITVAGCPMRDEISKRVTTAVAAVAGVTGVSVTLDVMSDEQRKGLHTQLRGDVAVRDIPFAQPGSLTRVYAVASGKGGVGKSTVTVNLAVAMAQQGMSVGVLDADIYGFSVPRLLGCTGKPTMVEKMIMPPQAYGVKAMSMGMFAPEGAPVAWRGPMLHRALQQFLADVFWGDLDVLLMDLPPGTGDIAISLGQLVPSSEILVVTTPQLAAREVAQRAGSIATQTRQNVVGVVENMGPMLLPDGSTLDLFGTGGGAAVAQGLTNVLGHDVPLLGSIPLDPALRTGGDEGVPLVVSHPDSAAGKTLRSVAEQLAGRRRGLAGLSLGISPVRKG
jgi:ATP-binding protein involved in chromosome partitioning